MHIPFNGYQTLCMFFFFNGGELVVLGRSLDLLLGWSGSPRHLLKQCLPFSGERDLDPLNSFYSYGITQLGPHFSAKLLSGGATTED